MRALASCIHAAKTSMLDHVPMRPYAHHLHATLVTSTTQVRHVDRHNSRQCQFPRLPMCLGTWPNNYSGLGLLSTYGKKQVKPRPALPQAWISRRTRW